MIDTAVIEVQVGAGGGYSPSSTYQTWRAPAVGAASEFCTGPKTRFGVALWYQLNTYDTDSDLGVYYRVHPHPRAHAPQLVLYWGHAFVLGDGSEHGPRVGAGALVVIVDKGTDPNSSSIKDVYPGLFAQGGYHGAYALPNTSMRLVAEITGMVGVTLGDKTSGSADWSIQARLSAGVQWRF